MIRSVARRSVLRGFCRPECPRQARQQMLDELCRGAAGSARRRRDISARLRACAVDRGSRSLRPCSRTRRPRCDRPPRASSGCVRSTRARPSRRSSRSSATSSSRSCVKASHPRHPRPGQRDNSHDAARRSDHRSVRPVTHPGRAGERRPHAISEGRRRACPRARSAQGARTQSRRGNSHRGGA